LAERAESAGVDVTLKVWQDMFHVWHAFAEMLPEGMEATQELADWVNSKLGRASARRGPSSPPGSSSPSASEP
jgi:acetyl esterase/lipase